MTDIEAIDRAIDLAIVGTDTDRNSINRQSLELQTLYDNAINKFADFIARDPNQRHLLTQRGSLTISNDGTTGYQYVTLPSDALSSMSRHFSFRDAAGNILVWIKNRNDFFAPQTPVYPYYWLEYEAAASIEIRVWLRAAGSSIPDFFGSISPIAIDYNFIPAAASQIPFEAENDFIAIFATLIKTGIENHTLVP